MMSLGDLDATLLEDSNKTYYSIVEVAQEFDLEPHTLRYWEKEFALLSPAKQGNKRVYTAEDIRVVRVIYTLLKIKGMTVKGARNMLKLGATKDMDKVSEVCERLDNIKAKIERILFEIENKE